MWRANEITDSLKVIKPYATRFWQKRFYHDGHGNDQIFANVWEYPPFAGMGPLKSYTMEIAIPDELSPTKRYLRIETFSFDQVDTDLWDQEVRTILTAMFPWMRKELD